MARLSGVLSRAQPIAFTDQLPLIFHGGDTPLPNIGLSSIGKPAIDERQIGLITQMYKDDSLAASVAEGFHVRDEVYQSISRENVAANRNAVSPKGFELSARRIALLMKDGYNLGFVDVGGWDTHVNQGGATGYLADRLSELGRGLLALRTKLVPTPGAIRSLSSFRNSAAHSAKTATRERIMATEASIGCWVARSTVAVL